MSRPRNPDSPYKQKIRESVRANSGQTTREYAAATGVSEDTTRRILRQLAGSGEIHYQLANPNNFHRAKWYFGAKPTLRATPTPPVVVQVAEGRRSGRLFLPV